MQPDNSTQTSLAGGAQCTVDCTVIGHSRLGNNLFHSFSQFSIPENVTVTFADGGASNIFARVSGGRSILEGTLAVTGSGNANFFLINPHGVTFGPQATLITAGSVIVSTADSIVFPNQVLFDATDTTLPPTLTVSAPVGLQFGQNPGALINHSQASPAGSLNIFGAPVGLQVNAGKTLALVSSGIFLEHGNLTANGGRIELGSVSAGSEVALSPEFHLSYQGVSAFQDIYLRQGTFVDASGDGGEIVAHGSTINLADTAVISNFASGRLSSSLIHLIANESINITGIGILFSPLPNSSSDGATLKIDTKLLTIQRGGVISGGTIGTGNGGNLVINALEAVNVSGVGDFSPSLITTATEGTGAGGDITINTRRLSITGGARIEAITYGLGQGGDVTVNATEQIHLSGTGVTPLAGVFASGILASSGLEERSFQPTGIGGSLRLITSELSLDRGAQVGVNSLGSGNAGNLEIQAQTVRLDNSSQITAASAFGNGGNIHVRNLETLILRRGSGISTRAGTGNGQGNGGNIDIVANFVVTRPFENSDIIATATRGRGGNIKIDTRGLYGISERRAIANNRTNDIDATSDFGVSGTIAVNNLVVEAEQQLVSLPSQTLTTTALIREGCAATGNRFVVTGPGGLPTHPTDAVDINAPLVDLGRSYASHALGRNLTAEAALDSTITALQQQPWIEANTVTTDRNNRVVLVAQPRSGSESPWPITSRCAA
ncbi:MAG: filamentous hemagglutinin N-terminal domain-containing protein [Phormidesmis sp. RL_2_1]|nr:filamentous hemagglutinin N-terminal domain-containing protein [Phormidesmis sp. RL_2_1]